MWNSERVRDGLQHSSSLIAYLALAIGCVIAFMYMGAITERIERESLVRTYENCVASNEGRVILREILDALAVEREDDMPGDFERRQRLRAELDEYIELRPCPPAPNGDVLDDLLEEDM